MKKLNKKGFTLIELLAVIVILAIILIIAIPSVTGLIDDAKKDSFLSTARMMKSSARLYTSTEESVVMPSEDNHAIVITAAELDMDNMGNDPDGSVYDTANSYIAIVFDEDTNTLEYYVTLVSQGANSRGLYMEVVDDLTKADVFADKADTVLATIGDITDGAWAIGGLSLTVDHIYDGTD